MSVYENHGMWMYDFKKKGVRHREGGYQNKRGSNRTNKQGQESLQESQ